MIRLYSLDTHDHIRNIHEASETYRKYQKMLTHHQNKTHSTWPKPIQPGQYNSVLSVILHFGFVVLICFVSGVRRVAPWKLWAPSLWLSRCKEARASSNQQPLISFHVMHCHVISCHFMSCHSSISLKPHILSKIYQVKGVQLLSSSQTRNKII